MANIELEISIPPSARDFSFGLGIANLANSKVDVSWGDGAGSSEEDANAGVLTHDYPASGVYKIDITINRDNSTYNTHGYILFGALNGQYLQRVLKLDAYIGPYSFANCSSLKSIPTIQSGYNSSSYYTPIIDFSGLFQGCSSLEYIKINVSGFTTEASPITTNMCAGCSNLKSIDIYGLEVIGENCFSGCKSLEYIFIASDVSIYSRAFADCTLLKNFYANSIYIKGNAVFQNCENLPSLNAVNIILAEGGIYSDLFSNMKKIKTFPPISISDTGSDINLTNAFRGCQSLIALPFTPPSSVSAFLVMNNMYSGCSNMVATVLLDFFQNRPNTVGVDCFLYCFKLENYSAISPEWGGGYVISTQNVVDIIGKQNTILSFQLDPILSFNGENIEVEYKTEKFPEGFSVSPDGTIAGLSKSIVVGAYYIDVLKDDYFIKSIKVNFKITNMDYISADVGTLGLKLGNKFIKIVV